MLLSTHTSSGKRLSTYYPENRIHSLLFCIVLLTGIVAPIEAQAQKPSAVLKPLTVRVDASKGAPRLTINGKPCRSRIFWGAPASGLIPLTSTGKQISFEFIPDQSELKTATMHLRFGQVPGEVFLDDLRITDLDTGKDVTAACDFEKGEEDFTQHFMVWPPVPQNTVGKFGVERGVGKDGSAGLHVRLTAPPDGNWPDFHIYHKPELVLIQGHRYRVSFWAKAEPERDLTVAFYRPGATYVYLGGPPGHFESQIRLAAGAGVDIVSCEVPMPWPAPGEPEAWQPTDTICEKVLKTNPRALILPRIGLYVPEWWKQAHPDELMRWEKGIQKGIASPASLLYRRDAATRLNALIQHLEAKFGDHMAGYHPTGQNTGEWFYMDSWERPLSGYAPCDVVAFRKWLQQSYGTVAALRKAWSDPTVDFVNAAIPSPEARHAAPSGIFRDFATERPIIDFTEFQQASMAECILDIARVTRKASQGRKLVVFFYGYIFEFGAMPTGPGVSGHYALRRLLDSPDIDILCSPISYFDRGVGMSAPAMTAAESVALAGKLWLNEDDTRTHLTREKSFPGSEHVVNTLSETNAELTRNVAQAALRNFGTWWMDLPGSGWFDDPGVWAEMARLNKLDEPLLQKPIPFRPQVAAVLDERSMALVAEGGTAVTRPGVYEVRGTLGRMGAPYGQYLLQDVLRGRVHPKLFVFLNAWRLSAQERTQLKQTTRGKTRLWCYAPGYFDDDQKSLTAMQELTGFVFKPVTNMNAWATPTATGKRLGLQQPFGVQQKLTPLFAVADAKPDELLATYPDGSAAIALRQTPDGPSLFVGVPGLSSELLRLAARKAGVHLFSETDCVIYANGPYLALHTTQAGTLQLNTGKQGAVRNVLTGEKLGNGPHLTLPLKKGETRILQTRNEK